MLELFLFFERAVIRIAGEISKDYKPAEASHEIYDVLVKVILLRSGAERIAHAGADDRGGSFRIAIMQAQSAGGNAHDIQNAIERLRQHFLNLAAHEAGRGEIQVRERQHVPFDAAPLLFVDGHHHQHCSEELRQSD